MPRRKAKLISREPNGRAQRDNSLAARQKRAQEAEDVNKVVVLNQPHRRGERSQWAATVLGRLCLRKQLEPELYQAGEAYGALVQRWRIAKGIPVQGRPGPSRGIEPDDATVAAWGQRIINIEDRLLDAGPGILGAIGWLILSDDDVWPMNEPAVIYGLRILADELGLLKLGQHPYSGRRA